MLHTQDSAETDSLFKKKAIMPHPSANSAMDALSYDDKSWKTKVNLQQSGLRFESRQRMHIFNPNYRKVPAKKQHQWSS